LNSATQLGIEEGYARWAPTYDHTINPVLALEERHITPLLTSSEQGAVLDLACGTGRWLQKLLSRGARLGTGVDCSAAMLAVANTKHALKGRLAAADCLRLPFRASVFDFAICSFAFGHIVNLKAAFFELVRVMKPDSDVFVTDLHPEACARGWRTRFRDERCVVEIEASPHTDREIVENSHVAGLERLEQKSLYFGEQERPLFEQAGKADLFDQARQIPAILFCHFRKL
jgi:malonyl-CoA O-methyltransferase